MTFEQQFVARVIYCEASPICDCVERELVASVIKNRIGHRGFGKLESMYEVVRQRNAFSCIDDKRNKNWQQTADYIKYPPKDNDVWEQCIALADEQFVPTENIVYQNCDEKTPRF